MPQKCSFNTQQQIVLAENIVFMTRFIKKYMTEKSLEIMFKLLFLVLTLIFKIKCYV